MKTICKIPVPEGSYIIDHDRHDNSYIFVYRCPDHMVKVFVFNFEKKEIIEIEDIQDLWESCTLIPPSFDL